MPQDSNASRKMVSFEELTYSNMLIVQALVELLEENGILTTDQVMRRVRTLKQETKRGKQT